MLSIARTACKARPPVLLHSRAIHLTNQVRAPRRHHAKKVPVREDHGLYGFFRRKNDAELSGEEAYEVIEDPNSQLILSGRAWEAAELRLKSFEDLHTLWYVALRERNLLATQKEEARRMGIETPEYQVSRNKVSAVKKTMARIKAVLNERRLAYLGAVALAEKEVKDYHDRAVLQSLLGGKGEGVKGKDAA